MVTFQAQCNFIEVNATLSLSFSMKLIGRVFFSAK